MKYFLFSIVIFCLPHILWLPRQIGVDPELIPLGLGNIVFIIAAILWVMGKMEGDSKKNPIKAFKYYFIIVLIGVLIAFMTQIEADPMVTLTKTKQQVCLLILYYMPLSFIRNKKDFVIFFIICLIVDVIIGYEVANSGVLSGMNFSDSKRGSGPFGESWHGSDVAAAYLAQVMAFFLACAIVREIKTRVRIASILGSVVILIGLLATYSRGAILSVFVGFVLMVFVLSRTIKKYIFCTFIISILSMLFVSFFLPQSIKTRFEGSVNDVGQVDKSTEGRFFYWNTALLILKDYPLGVGTSQVRAAMQKYTGSASVYTGTGIYVDPHNGFLHTICEYGLIGLFVFMWLLWTVFKESRAIFLDNQNPIVYRTYALGFIGMLGTLVSCNMFYSNFYKDLVLGTLMIHFGMLAYIVAWKRSVSEGA